MKKLYEDSNDPRVAEGMARIAKLDGDIASLRQQIAKAEQQKSDISTEIAKITGQNAVASEEGNNQDQKANTDNLAKQIAAAVTAAQGAGTNESLLEQINMSEDESDRINLEIDQLADQIVYYQEHYDGDEETKEHLIDELMTDIAELQNQLKELEMDQMEHESQYDDDDVWTDPAGGIHYGDEDDPAAMYEAYASKFRPGKMIWKGKEYWISKVENVNPGLDTVIVDGKTMSSKFLEKDGAEMVEKPRKEREKRMTKREYERELKDVVSSLKADGMEIDHSIMYDMAENLYHNSDVKDYVIKRWQKERLYDMPFLDKELLKYEEPSKNEIIKFITNDLEMSESYNPMSIENFYDLSEAYVEHINKESEEDYINKDYVFYVKINDKGNEFIGKIFKVRPDGDWFGQVAQGDSDTFAKISYEPEYDEMDIVEFLGENYDQVEIIDMHEYNEYIEEDDIDEDIIGGSAWPTNSVASS